MSSNNSSSLPFSFFVFCCYFLLIYLLYTTSANRIFFDTSLDPIFFHRSLNAILSTKKPNPIHIFFSFLFRKPFSFCVNSPHIVSSATELNFLDCITKTPFCLLHPQPPIYLLCSQISFSMLCCCAPMLVGPVLFTLLLTPIFSLFFLDLSKSYFLSIVTELCFLFLFYSLILSTSLLNSIFSVFYSPFSPLRY